MASIRREVVLHVPLYRVWEALRDVGALHTRLVPGFVTETKLNGAARIVTFSNGMVVRELIAARQLGRGRHHPDASQRLISVVR